MWVLFCLILCNFLNYAMSEFQQIIDQIKAFRDARDWEQFHNSKDLAVALSVEASEPGTHYTV